MKYIILLLLLMSNNLLSLELKGKIIHISDGDTAHLLTDKKEKIKIRLSDIDAPENKQAFGNKSKENLKSYIYQKNVVVEYKDKDKYQRVLGTIYYQNKDINLQQVKDGYAWVYKKYSKKLSYNKAEDEARDKNKGLWSDKNPIEPWEFRKNKNKIKYDN
ncbi:thermonuclease family protein [Aliarcobacter cryaerophilus]|uniref:thermonuclease family protein n=1 Tax=Aliarcobacter cryaerophilus TaxID=28198 RepID=UPI0021B4988B|nr:thermonuclease family protein [Aliarcobacter cryaerophilus]MCT7523305.1 thermonuclease family protein [Aliarcobacter cryaerophilus]